MEDLGDILLRSRSNRRGCSDHRVKAQSALGEARSTLPRLVRCKPRRRSAILVGDQDRIKIRAAVIGADVPRAVAVLRIEDVAAAHVAALDHFGMLAPKPGQPGAVLIEQVAQHRVLATVLPGVPQEPPHGFGAVEVNVRRAEDTGRERAQRLQIVQVLR